MIACKIFTLSGNWFQFRNCSVGCWEGFYSHSKYSDWNFWRRLSSNWGDRIDILKTHGSILPWSSYFRRPIIGPLSCREVLPTQSYCCINSCNGQKIGGKIGGPVRSTFAVRETASLGQQIFSSIFLCEIFFSWGVRYKGIESKSWLVLNQLSPEFTSRRANITKVNPEKTFRNPIKSTRNQIVFTIFRLI